MPARPRALGPLHGGDARPGGTASDPSFRGAVRGAACRWRPFGGAPCYPSTPRRRACLPRAGVRRGSRAPLSCGPASCCTTPITASGRRSSYSAPRPGPAPRGTLTSTRPPVGPRLLNFVCWSGFWRGGAFTSYGCRSLPPARGHVWVFQPQPYCSVLCFSGPIGGTPLRLAGAHLRRRPDREGLPPEAPPRWPSWSTRPADRRCSRI
jgi:hypothetical protein